MPVLCFLPVGPTHSRENLLHAATIGCLTLIAITLLGLHWLHYNIAWAPSLFAIINSFVFFSPSQQIINLDYRLQKD